MNCVHFVVVLLLLAFQVVSVTFIKGGEAFNVIPESVTMGDTFRSMTNEGLSYLMKRIREVTNTYLDNKIDDTSETHHIMFQKTHYSHEQ